MTTKHIIISDLFTAITSQSHRSEKNQFWKLRRGKNNYFLHNSIAIACLWWCQSRNSCKHATWSGPCWAGGTGGHVPLRPPLIKGLTPSMNYEIVIKFNEPSQKITNPKKKYGGSKWTIKCINSRKTVLKSYCISFAPLQRFRFFFFYTFFFLFRIFQSNRSAVLRSA